MNRITAHIAKYRTALTDRLASGKITRADIDRVNTESAMEWAEYSSLQNLKSLAVLSGKLTVEEGQTIYGILGNAGPEAYNRSTDAATKAVMTLIHSELLTTFPNGGRTQTVPA